jgi:iduronate 2-sulfatase
MNLRKISLSIICLSIICCIYKAKAQQNTTKRNVLFIAIDDLKPILGCYGDSIIKTPNIDRLAKLGTVFKSNYCQQAVCGPTRASLMTGMRPDYTKVWDLKTKMRDINPNIVSIPQYFASYGYTTQGIGKVYDPRCVDDKNDEPSWTVPYYKTDKKYYSALTGEPALGQYQNKETKLLIAKYLQEAELKGLDKKEARDAVSLKIKPSTENEDVPDNAYTDGANILQAKNILKGLKNKQQPFFFAVGISKPHLPFVAPKKYKDLYQNINIPLASFQEKSINGVDLAYHNAGEIRAYSDINEQLSLIKQKEIGVTFQAAKQQELLKSYYAAVSFADAQVGILLNTLDSLNLTNQTIIVLWGDHGWHLGDHNLWCKHSNFEQATNVPLICYDPSIKPSVTQSITEFVDIFPTLCDLAGLPIPNNLAGKSLTSIMKDPNLKVKEFAISQYPRSSTKLETERQGYAASKIMGYSLRNKRYRFTLWLKDFKSNQSFNDSFIVGIELYDYEKDPLEKINLATDKEYNAVAKQLKNEMIGFFKTQIN